MPERPVQTCAIRPAVAASRISVSRKASHRFEPIGDANRHALLKTPRIGNVTQMLPHKRSTGMALILGCVALVCAVHQLRRSKCLSAVAMARSMTVNR